MLRMEIALFLVLAFVAGIYFSAGGGTHRCTGRFRCCCL